MADENELFDQRIHDALENVRLGDEARQRMLTNLLVRQLRVQIEGDSIGSQDEAAGLQTPLTEGLGMARTSSPQKSISAPRRVGPRHAAHAAAPAMESAQTIRIASVKEAEGSAITARNVASTESLQTTTVVLRRTGPKHFRTNEMDAASAAESSSADNQATNPSKGKTSHAQSKSPLKLLLPLAAALCLVFVVAQVSGILRNAPYARKNPEAENSAKSVATEATNADAAGTVEGPELLANDGEEMAPEAVAPVNEEATDESKESVRTETNVDYYPFITLEDGTSLTALREGLYVDEVDEAQVRELVGEANASSFDAPDEAAISCLVYRLEGDDSAYAVQYDGEDTYWLCTRI